MAKLYDFQWQITVPDGLLNGATFDRYDEVGRQEPFFHTVVSFRELDAWRIKDVFALMLFSRS